MSDEVKHMDTSESQNDTVKKETPIINNEERTNDPGHLSFEEVLHNNATVEEQDEGEKRAFWSGRRKTIALGGVAFVAAVGIGVGGTLLLGPRSNQPKAHDAPDDLSKDKQTSAAPISTTSPSPIAVTTPEATPTTAPQESTVPTPELSVNESNDQLAQDVLKQVLINWRGAGVSHDAVEQQTASGLSAYEYAAKVANDTEKTYTDALFIDNWDYNHNLKTFADQVHQEQEDGIGMSIVTAHEPLIYAWQTNYVSYTLANQSPGETNMVVHFTDTNTAGQFNEAVKYPELLHESGAYDSLAVRLVNSGKTFKIADIQMFAAQ